RRTSCPPQPLRHVQSASAEGRDDRLDRKQEQAAFFRVLDEISAVQVEALRAFVLRLYEHGTYAKGARCGGDTTKRVQQQIGAEALPGVIQADRQTADDRHRYHVGGIP